MKSKEATTSEDAAVGAAQELRGAVPSQPSPQSPSAGAGPFGSSGAPKVPLTVHFTSIGAWPWGILLILAVASCFFSLKFNNIGGFITAAFYLIMYLFIKNDVVEGDDTFNKRLGISAFFGFIAIGLGNWISVGTWFWFIASVFALFVVSVLYKNAGITIGGILKMAMIIMVFLVVMKFISPLQVFLDGSIPEALKNISMFALLIFGYGNPIFMTFNIKHHDTIVTLFFSLLVASVVLVYVLNVVAPTFMASNLGIVGASANSEQREILSDIIVDVIEGFKKAPGVLKQTFADSKNRTLDLYNRSLQYATTGKTYEEEVDAQASVQSLGVNFQSVELTSPDARYLQGDPVSVWAILESKSLDRGIDVSIDCVTKLPKGDEKVGNVNNPKFNIKDQDIRDILCTYDKDTFQKVGTHVLTLGAKFNYTTGSYLRRYFISEEDSQSVRESGQDPIQYFDIPTEDEASIFTNGPISLSVVKHGLLQSIDTSYKEFVVGYRVENNVKYGMDGKMADVQSFVISLPDGLVLKPSSTGKGYECTSPAEFEVYSADECIDKCRKDGIDQDRCYSDCAKYNMYKLTSEMNKDEEGNIKLPFIVSCNVEARNPMSFLGKDLIAIKNFRASIDYTYEVTSSSSFTVGAKDGYTPVSELDDFCEYKTAYFDYSESDPEGVYKLAQKYVPDGVWGNSFGGFSCSKMKYLVSAVIAMRYRRGADNKYGLGLTGITEYQAELAFKQDPSIKIDATSLREDDVNNVKAFKAYIDYMVNGKCSLEGKKLLDCAINEFLENERNPAPAVIQLTRYLEEKQPWAK